MKSVPSLRNYRRNIRVLDPPWIFSFYRRSRRAERVFTPFSLSWNVATLISLALAAFVHDPSESKIHVKTVETAGKGLNF